MASSNVPRSVRGAASPVPALGVPSLLKSSSQVAGPNQAVAMNLRSEHKHVEMRSSHERKRRREHDSLSRAALMHRRIYPTVANSYVKRTYRSTTVNFNNSTGTTAEGFAYSVRCYYDSDGGTGQHLEIILGSPFGGTQLLDVDDFPDYETESDYLDRIFRTKTLKKASLCVITLPQQVMDLQENSTAANVHVDTGVVYMLPWTGRPNVASYSNGQVSSILPIDYDRLKEKVKFGISSSIHPRTRELCVRPMIGKVVATGDQSHTAAPPVDIEYVPVPRVDTGSFLSETEQLNGYGWVLYWYHPDLEANVSNSVVFQYFFELEFEWSGIRIPEAMPAPMAQGLQVGPEARQVQGGLIDMAAVKSMFKPLAVASDADLQVELDMRQKYIEHEKKLEDVLKKMTVGG